MKTISEAMKEFKMNEESFGFELWDAKGKKMYASGKAKNPDHAVELIQKEMKKHGDKSAEGLLIQDGDSIETYKYDDIMESKKSVTADKIDGFLMRGEETEAVKFAQSHLDKEGVKLKVDKKNISKVKLMIARLEKGIIPDLKKALEEGKLNQEFDDIKLDGDWDELKSFVKKNRKSLEEDEGFKVDAMLKQIDGVIKKQKELDELVGRL